MLIFLIVITEPFTRSFSWLPTVTKNLFFKISGFRRPYHFSSPSVDCGRGSFFSWSHCYPTLFPYVEGLSNISSQTFWLFFWFIFIFLLSSHFPHCFAGFVYSAYFVSLVCIVHFVIFCYCLASYDTTSCLIKSQLGL